MTTMHELSGISASPGIAIGKVFLHLEESLSIPRYAIRTENIEGEVRRLEKAVNRASDEIMDLRAGSQAEKQDEQVKLLDTHLLMLHDPDFTRKITSDLKAKRLNIEWILSSAIDEVVTKLRESGNDYLSERSTDLNDVTRRVLNHLLSRERVNLADLSEEVILITHDLLPSDAISMNKRMVKGICMDAGGKTSHTAILARSFEIPAVVGLSTVSREVQSGDQAIVDGNRGRLIINPDAKTLKRYIRVQSEWRKREVQLMGLNELPAETKDGKLISLKANIEVPEEVDSILAHGADGVGLFRSEFLFLHPGKMPEEQEQYEAYSYVLKQMGNKPVTIRTLDVGGDKVVPDMEGMEEKNPILGWRAIRFCLSKPELFRTQLRALLRASMHGNLQIMFPMISGVEELSRALSMLDEVKADLRREKVPFQESTPVGTMIEVPSAAITADLLATRSQFFSIGTNDLIQYTIAVDRGNEKIAYLYEPFHPGVLRLLKMIIDSAHAVGIPVGMCGEMAGDPLATVVLLGLGLDEFSMGAVGIPEVKRIIRSVTLSEAEQIVGNIMEMKSFNEIDQYVNELMDTRFGVKAY
ncbi:MAG TPA: phosphoenolpyruvate--protein phosphotransferase [Spirochaetia bacterium]|nr:phosphoenolpyruvate--protein phosphotransferase [Spirochaetia bacterium]